MVTCNGPGFDSLNVHELTSIECYRSRKEVSSQREKNKEQKPKQQTSQYTMNKCGNESKGRLPVLLDDI